MTQVTAMKQITASVISNEEVMSDTYLIWLDSPDVIKAQPGQFVMVKCGEETLLRRPLGIHQINETDGGTRLALLFTIVGRGTRWLSQRKAGDTLDLLGPLGNGYTVNPSSHNLLLLAGGIGIAPLCFLAQRAVAQGHSVKLLLGTPTASKLYPQNHLPSEAELATSTDDGTAGRKGMITDILPEYIDWADQVFACGPLPMYLTMADHNLKAKPVQISLETRMGCGFGICFSCTVRTKRGLKQVCRDGPIFDLDEILWNELNLT